MSHSTLIRQLKRLTGLTPVQYLQEMRLDKARHLLENRSHDSIVKVAAEVGYKDARSFSRLIVSYLKTTSPKSSNPFSCPVPI